MKILNSLMKRKFYSLGWFIGEHPKTFVIIPILITSFLGLGVIKGKLLTDYEYLFAPTTGESVAEKQLVRNYFPLNETGQFDPYRKVSIGFFARLIIVPQDEKNILTSDAWSEIQMLDSYIHNITISHDGKYYQYKDICSSWQDDCFENDILGMGGLIERAEKSEARVEYPLTFDPLTFSSYATGLVLGGIEKGEGFELKSAKSLTMHYFVRSEGGEEEELLAKDWERALVKFLKSEEFVPKHIKCYYATITALEKESREAVLSTIPYTGLSAVLASIFIITSLLMKDWVRSKPWLGFAAGITAGLGTVSGIGLLIWLDLSFIMLNVGIPFLMFGIGLDDAFVVMAAWRRTSIKDSVPKRLAETYAEASVSITITSITDSLSFMVGIFTPLRAIQIFSVYSSVCVAFIYLWQLFFFGGCVALSGYHEENNRHGLFFWKKAIPKSKSENLTKFQKLMWVGGTEEDSKTKPIHAETENKQMKFFRDTFTTFLLKRNVQILIVLGYIGYVVISALGVMRLDNEFIVNKMFRYDSFMYEFNSIHDELVTGGYGDRYQLIIYGEVDYSNKTIQEAINKMLYKAEHLKYTTPEFEENWLASFNQWAKTYKEFEDINIDSKQGFIDVLREKFLLPSKHISTDVRFNDNFTEIIASRFIIQTKNYPSRVSGGMYVLSNLRKLCEEQTLFNCNVYHYWAGYIDENILIKELSVKLLLAASAVVLIISVIFVPNLKVSLCVCFTIASTQLGIIGTMSWWSVSLDPIALLALIMCIGFCVDFSVHVSYLFVSNKKLDDVEDRIRETMYGVGLPCFQGAVSTMLAGIPLILVPSYTFVVFFKVIMLVMIFALYHALVVLPTIFYIFGRIAAYGCFGKTQGSYYVTKM